MRCTALTLMRRPVMAKGGRDEWLETTGMLADNKRGRHTSTHGTGYIGGCPVRASGRRGSVA